MQGHAVLDVAIAQFPVSLEPADNLRVMHELAERLASGSLVVFPEGAVSGYEETADLTKRLDVSLIEHGRQAMGVLARRCGLHIFYGSCIQEGGRWFNAALYAGPRGESFVYRKINLATLERTGFAAGDALSCLDADMGGDAVRIGIQLCREIRFPEQWQALARQGASLFVYPTFATGNANEFSVWRSHLISRAAENQRFVLAANTAHVTQKCPSMIVAPDGSVLAELPHGETGLLHTRIDLKKVSDWYLDQARRDIVELRTGDTATA